jgi:NAD(P)-dependent dehydrogenase (short-subunit alcohol dehydrogenase family)
MNSTKVWFVTGAGSGIGAGIVKAALLAGERVVASARDLDKLRSALRDVASADLALVQLDVNNETQAKNAVQAAIKRFGRIDVLVNNAGYSLLGNFEELSMPDIERQFATNLFGVMRVMRAVLPVMRQQRAGHIINISSSAGAMGFKHCGAYSASKFAVEGLSLSVAQEIEQFNIKVTIVEPGFFRTDLLDERNVSYAQSSIADYAHEGSAQQMWSGYDGVQPGNPDRLGDVLVKLAAMAAPPHIFVAGSDALAMLAPAVEARLQAVHAREELSRATDGFVTQTPASA